MEKEIFVECIGFSDTHNQRLKAAFRLRLLSYRSSHFEFRFCDACDSWSPSAPAVSIVAVGDRNKWRRVLSSVLTCRSNAICLFGPKSPVLGLPVIQAIEKFDELILLAGFGEGGMFKEEPYWGLFREFKSTIPATW